MNNQQKRTSQHIVIWRESVAAGDDAFAPHEKKIKVENDESIESTLNKVLAIHYLPSIQGGKATWIVMGKKPLAVIAQHWSKPDFLVEATTRTENLIEFTSDHQLEFKYWCQVEPEEVVASLKEGKPLPDKYGRDKQKETNVFERITKSLFKR